MDASIRLFIGASTLVLLGFLNAAAQAPKKMAVVIPSDVLLPMVVSQPECPLKIENVRLVRFFNRDDYASGGSGVSYILRNTGRKSIVGYTIASWYSNNSGSVVDWRVNGSERALASGTVRTLPNDLATVTLTDELRKKLDLMPPLKMMRLFMVIEVTFSDGTKYDATGTFAALRQHLDSFETVYEKQVR